MRGMPGGRPRLEVEHPLADYLDRRLGNRSELAPETVELVAVEPARAPLELAGVDEVRRADLADVDGQPSVPLCNRACCAGVIEVDVREDEVP